MTSEPDSDPGRRPPTIELTATEVENPASAPDTAATDPAGDRAAEGRPSENRAGARSAGRLGSHVVSAVIAALTTAVILAGLWLAGFVPSQESTAPAVTTAPPSTTDADNRINGISARLDRIEKTISAPRSEPALDNRLAATEAEIKSLGDLLATQNRRLDDIATTAQSAAKSADASSAAADAAKNAAQGGIQRSDIDALTAKIASLESAMKALSDTAARRASSADDNAARLTIAAEALRAAVERRASYQAELLAVQSLGADAGATAPLEPFAASGIPSAAALAHELATLTPDLERVADVAPGDATFLKRLETNAEKLVRITPVDAPAGNDPATVIVRINVDAARGDIAGALADLDALPESTKPITADWVKKAQAREAAIAASRRIAADALAALAKPGVQ
jgi:hypothetical protein